MSELGPPWRFAADLEQMKRYVDSRVLLSSSNFSVWIIPRSRLLLPL